MSKEGLLGPNEEEKKSHVWTKEEKIQAIDDILECRREIDFNNVLTDLKIGRNTGMNGPMTMVRKVSHDYGQFGNLREEEYEIRTGYFTWGENWILKEGHSKWQSCTIPSVEYFANLLKRSPEDIREQWNKIGPSRGRTGFGFV